MKKIILFYSLIVFLTPHLCFSQSNPDFKNKFTFGIFNYFPFDSAFYKSSFHQQNYKDLSFNLLEAHMGDRNSNHDATRLTGGFYDPVSSYESNVVSMFTAMRNDFEVNAGIIMNEVINRSCYGQASKYQAENIGSWDTVYPGYGYMKSNTGTDETEILNGETIISRTAKIGRDNPGYLVRELYENMEQVNFNSDWGPYVSDVKFVWPNYRWYIRPKMRIDAAYAKNNPNDTIVKIIILKFDGNLLKEVPILCRNFYDANGNYDGSYKEVYNFPKSSTYPLSFIQATELNENHIEKQEQSRVDYQVYWNGRCNVWLDYVGVYDEWAQDLFNPEFKDAATGRTYDFENKIIDVTDSLTHIPGYSYFYIDEFEYNMIPSIAKVNEIIKNKNPQSAVIPLFSQSLVDDDYWMSDALRNSPPHRKVIEYLKSTGAVTDIFLSEPYPFEDKIPLPPNVKKPDAQVYPRTINYYNAKTNNEYNDSLNNFIERTRMHFFRDMAWATKNTDIMFSLMPQVFSYEIAFNDNKNDPDYYILREPFHEEISLQNYLGLAYGAKQILYFIYQSLNFFTPPAYNWGLLNYDGTRRLTNYYGLSKWDSLTRLNSVILKLGQFMVDQKRLNYDVTRSINIEGLPYKYIQDIKSVYRNRQLMFPQTGNEDPLNKLYWEIGFFDPNESIEPNSNSKYFLAVNKRCAPELKPGEGDLRELKIRFNYAELANYDEWKLIDAINNQIIATININSEDYISTRVFKPGEGRLFKLEPVQ